MYFRPFMPPPTPMVAHMASSTIPAKVQAAQQFLYFMDTARQPASPHRPFGYSLDPEPALEVRPLTKREEAAYNAALDLFTQYFLGEQDYTEGGHNVYMVSGMPDGPPGPPQIPPATE